MSPSKKNPQPPHTPEAPLEFSLDSASKQHLEVGPGVSVHAPLMPSVQYARQSPPRQFLVQSEEPQPLPSKRKSIPTAKAQYLIQNNDNEESQIARNIFESNKGLELECISVGEPEDQDSSGNPNIFESARKEHEGALSNDKGNEGASSTEASDPSKWETPLGNFRKKDEKKPFRPTALHGFNPDALRDAVNKSSSAYQTPPPTVKKRARSPQDEVESPSPVKKRLDNQDLGSPVPKANESSSIPATFVLTWPDGRQVKVQEVLEKSPADLPSSVGGNNSQRGTNDPIHTSNSNVRKTESSAPTAPASKQAFGTDDSIHTSNSNVRKTESSAPTAPTSKQTFDIPPAIPSSPEPEYVPAEPWTFERDPEKEAEVERSFMELTVPPLVRFTASIQKFDSQTQRKMMNRYHAKAKYKDFPENIRQIFKPRWQDRLMRDFYLKSAAQPHSALLRPSMLVPYTIATSAEKKTRIFASFHRVVEPMSPVAATTVSRMLQFTNYSNVVNLSRCPAAFIGHISGREYLSIGEGPAQGQNLVSIVTGVVYSSHLEKAVGGINKNGNNVGGAKKIWVQPFGQEIQLFEAVLGTALRLPVIQGPIASGALCFKTKNEGFEPISAPTPWELSENSSTKAPRPKKLYKIGSTPFTLADATVPVYDGRSNSSRGCTGFRGNPQDWDHLTELAEYPLYVSKGDIVSVGHTISYRSNPGSESVVFNLLFVIVLGQKGNPSDAGEGSGIETSTSDTMDF